MNHCTECIDCPYGVDISVFVCMCVCNHAVSSLSHSLLPIWLQSVLTICRLDQFELFETVKKSSNSSPPVFLYLLWGSETRVACFFVFV